MKYKLLAVVLMVLVVLLALYSFPYIVSAKVTNLDVGSSVFLYGIVTDRISLGGLISGFVLHEGSGSVFVAYNGTLPALGEKVLAYGTVRQYLGGVYVRAAFVTWWP